MTPEPGNELEAEGVLNPASGHTPDGRLHLLPRLVAPGNVSRVGYSPGAMGHLLKSYEQQHQCRLNPAPDAFDDDAMREARAVSQTDTMSLTKCACDNTRVAAQPIATP